LSLRFEQQARIPQTLRVLKSKKIENYIDLLEKSLDEIQKKLNYIKHGMNNGIDLLKEYCIELRNDVQLITEKTIEQINQLNKELSINSDTNKKQKEEIRCNRRSTATAITKLIELR
jgi:hypothetical protein